MPVPDSPRSRPLSADVAGLENAKSINEIREAILEYLETHRIWYARSSARFGFSWNLLTFLVLTLGALTSILTAIGNVAQWILIGLPAISSLCAALLIQFRLKESCRLRDHGKIAMELLICKGLTIQGDDVEKARRSAIRLREAAHRIELEQLAEFTSEDRNGDERNDNS